MIVFLCSFSLYRILFYYCIHIFCLLCSFYTAEIVCGLEFLHSLGIIYRYVLDSLGIERICRCNPPLDIKYKIKQISKRKILYSLKSLHNLKAN